MRSLFRNRTFRRLFLGRLITNAGDSAYAVAAMWLAFQLGGSSFYTGLAGFLTMLPQTLQFLAGPLVDRWQIRRILVGTQLAQAIFVLIIPVAYAMGWLTVWVVLVVMPVLSLLNQFVYPAEQAALPRVVEKDELVEANSAFSFAYQGVDFAFTALGGIVVAVMGAISLYVMDSVTFLAATAVFLGMKIPAAESQSNGDGEGGEGEEGDGKGKKNTTRKTLPPRSTTISTNSVTASTTFAGRYSSGYSPEASSSTRPSEVRWQSSRRTRKHTAVRTPTDFSSRQSSEACSSGHSPRRRSSGFRSPI